MLKIEKFSLLFNRLIGYIVTTTGEVVLHAYNAIK